MIDKLASGKSKKPSLVLTPRDVTLLVQLYLHRAISSSQLAALCFPEISYETARKRLRRIQQAGFTGASTSGRMEGRGRPELIYFLTTNGARALEQHHGISWETIPTGPPHSYHKEHFLRLVDIRLSLQAAAQQNIVADLSWATGKEFWQELSSDSNSINEADATITFSYPGHDPIKVLLEIDTGNFRQTRHWDPKIRSFLTSGFPIWVVTGSETRILTLRKWTAPLLEEAGVGPGKVVFSIYDDVIRDGIFSATWYRTDGSITNLRPKVLEQK